MFTFISEVLRVVIRKAIEMSFRYSSFNSLTSNVPNNRFTLLEGVQFNRMNVSAAIQGASCELWREIWRIAIMLFTPSVQS